MISRQYLAAILLTAFASFSACAEPQEHDKKISETVTLRVAEMGQGEPVIFVHGSTGDHTVWHEHLPVFAKKGYRAIAYSRRYNWPNANEPEPNHSAIVEAEDLDRLSEILGLRKFHLVGHSYGGYTALLFALAKPAKVASLTLAEPPVVPWLKEIEGEQSDAALKHYTKLHEEFIIPARRQFNLGNDDQALRVFLDAVVFKGAIDHLPKADIDICRRNLAELRALVKSHNSYPLIGKQSLRAMAVPVLLVSGGDSSDVGKYTDPYLMEILSTTRERVIIPGANHVMWKTSPKQANAAVLNFIGRYDKIDEASGAQLKSKVNRQSQHDPVRLIPELRELEWLIGRFRLVSRRAHTYHINNLVIKPNSDGTELLVSYKTIARHEEHIDTAVKEVITWDRKAKAIRSDYEVNIIREPIEDSPLGDSSYYAGKGHYMLKRSTSDRNVWHGNGRFRGRHVELTLTKLQGAKSRMRIVSGARNEVRFDYRFLPIAERQSLGQPGPARSE